jgi:hypothetical protein
MIKTLLIALFSAILLSGCFWDDKLCVVPKPAMYDTSAFKHKNDIKYQYWVDQIDENNSIVVQTPVTFYDNIEEIKTLKSDYNLLLDGINNFNNDLNKTQKD